VTVTEEKDVQTTISLSNADDGAIRVLLDTPIASEQVKKALTKAQALRASWAQIKAEREQKDRDLKEITDDQARLRANLREMPTTAEAYKRYLTKFDRQEEEIERLQGVIRTLRQREYEARTAYEAYLRNLRVE
jgi:chromosome segregation ATPase